MILYDTPPSLSTWCKCFNNDVQQIDGAVDLVNIECVVISEACSPPIDVYVRDNDPAGEHNLVTITIKAWDPTLWDRYGIVVMRLLFLELTVMCKSNQLCSDDKVIPLKGSPSELASVYNSNFNLSSKEPFSMACVEPD